MPVFRRRPAAIARSVQIQGEVTCADDLVIEGSVTGSVTLDDARLTIGRTGRVTATVRATVVQVDGLVVGDVVGARLVVVTGSGTVQGNLIGPRVVLEPGARINGSVDMSVSEPLPTARPD